MNEAVPLASPGGLFGGSGKFHAPALCTCVHRVSNYLIPPMACDMSIALVVSVNVRIL